MLHGVTRDLWQVVFDARVLPPPPAATDQVTPSNIVVFESAGATYLLGSSCHCAPFTSRAEPGHCKHMQLRSIACDNTEVGTSCNLSHASSYAVGACAPGRL